MRLKHLVGTLVLAALAVAPAAGQERTEGRDTTAKREPYLLEPINVTATRTAKRVFETPTPVSVLDRSAIRQLIPNTISDLFRGLPGLDVAGVGTNQVRPIIRGQRGQRILVVQDGIRLNNTRRQQDFGEIPALVDVATVERVEIVRGPASVLYGSDAIGGAVNIITRTPVAEGLRGAVGYRYGSTDAQSKVTGGVSGRVGRVGFLATGALRRASAYEAPAGSFGEITLGGDTRVNDTGVDDEALDLYGSYALGEAQHLFLRYGRYRADQAGFGFVDPLRLTLPDSVALPPLIQIRYPFQQFDKVTAGYRASGLATPMANRVELTAYVQDNERRLDNDIAIAFGPPGAGMQVRSRNFTDVETVGARLEAAKLVGGRLLLTYGFDFFRDEVANADTSVTTVTGFGPPTVRERTSPSLPNASFRSAGAFFQGEIPVTARASLILGARYQSVRAATEATPGLPDSLAGQRDDDHTVVAAANAIYELTEGLSLVGSVGRAFRSPNLVERFFSGIVPEGGAYQSRNPDLQPETSFNVDLGLRYRRGALALEGFVFQNYVYDGIRIDSTGRTVSGLPEFRNINVEKLRYRGVELAADAQLPYHLSLGASYTHLDTEDVLERNNPVGDSYDDKLRAALRYTHPTDRFWVEYDLRVNGERRDADIGMFSVVGPTLPSFTVHTLRGGVTLLRRGAHTHRLGLAVTNLTNALYAEFSNAGFFRPEPKRGVTVTYDVTF